jgi:hypothetical protein
MTTTRVVRNARTVAAGGAAAVVRRGVMSVRDAGAGDWSDGLDPASNARSGRCPTVESHAIVWSRLMLPRDPAPWQR